MNTIYTDEFEVRASVSEGIKKLYLNGTALVSGVVDSYNTVFSKKTLQSLKKSFEGQDIDIDINHAKEMKNRIRNRLTQLRRELGNTTSPTADKLLQEADDYAAFMDFPDLKINDIKLNDSSVEIESYLNPALESIYPEYFKAVTEQINTGVLNGYSIQFDPKSIKAHHEMIDGRKVRVIDDAKFTKVSLVSHASIPGTSGLEVMVRMADEKLREDENKMVEENEMKELKTKVEELEKAKTDSESKIEELSKELKAKEKAKEVDDIVVDDQDKEITALNERLSGIEELLKKSLEKKYPDARGIVLPEDKYGTPLTGEQVEDVKKQVSDKVGAMDLENLLEAKDKLKAQY